MTVGRKLAIGFGLMLALILGSGLGSLQMIRGLGSTLDRAVDRTAKKMRLADSLLSGFRQVRLASTLTEISLMNATLMGKMTLVGRDQISCDSCHTLDNAAAGERNVAEAFDETSRAAAELAALVSNPAEREAIERVQRGLSEWQTLYAEYLKKSRQLEFTAAHEIVLERIYPLVGEVETAARRVREAEAQELASTRAGAAIQVRSSLLREAGVVLISAGIGVAVLLLIRRTTKMLRGSSSEIAEMTAQLASATSHIASASEALAQTATEQSAALEITCASSEEIRASSAANVEGMSAASATTKDVNARVETANRLLRQTAGAMEQIDASAQQISRIAAMIDEIAFQTNLLSLNAAIEAARAGAAGQGFGVVADEVRRLAQQCASAAQDAGSLIGNSIAASRDGKARLEELASAIGTITDLTGAVHGKVESVNSASVAQQQSVDHMGRAVSQMEQVTSSIAACAEENASASEELRAQADTLRHVAGALKELVG